MSYGESSVIAPSPKRIERNSICCQRVAKDFISTNRKYWSLVDLPDSYKNARITSYLCPYHFVMLDLLSDWACRHFEELRIKLVHIVRCSLFQDCCSHMCYPDISAGKFVSLGLAVWIESCCKKYGATFGFICLTSCARLKKRFRTCVKPRKPHRWDLTMWIPGF